MIKNDANKQLNSFSWMLRTFKYRNYRVFFTGQGISLIGTWIHYVAVNWLVYRLTNSSSMLGLVSFIGAAPSLLLSPIAGVYADRYDRKKIILIAQTLALVQALVLSYLVFTHKISIAYLILLNGMMGLISSFDMPFRQAFVADIIEKKEDFVNAIAMNSAMFNSARLIGPPIAGILIKTSGEGWCFLLNSISYIAIIIALFIIKPKPFVKKQNQKHVLSELKDGIKYSLNHKPILYTLLIIMMVSIAGIPYLVLSPIIAKVVLKGGSDTYGYLLSAVGVGAVCGAIFMASRKKEARLWNIITKGTIIFSLSLMGYSQSKILWLSMLMMSFNGFGVMTLATSGNTLIQTLVEDDKRGRLTGLYVLAFMGMMPIGNLIAGFVAKFAGAPNTLCGGGVILFICAIIFHKKIKSVEHLLLPRLEELKTAKPAIIEPEDRGE